MSAISESIKLWAFVSFESRWNLHITAGVISDQLLAGIPFSEEVPGLREEVPAVTLTKEVFGLNFVLYGECEGERCSFTLEAHPGKALYWKIHGAKTVDIGKWLAELVETVPEFKVTGCSPIELV